jgi:hypothetical protein
VRREKTILDEDERKKHDFDSSDIKTINDKVKREKIQSNRVFSSNKTIEFEILSKDFFLFLFYSNNQTRFDQKQKSRVIRLTKDRNTAFRVEFLIKKLNRFLFYEFTLF